jgi:CRP/FNR family transcriptional regulator, cyclic AMP receptor protein
MLPKLTLRSYAPGESLYRQGDSPSGIYGVLSGQINTIGTAADGHLSLLSILRAGEWTGFLGMLDGQPNPFTTTAAIKSEILVLPSTAASAIFSKTPDRLDLILQPLLVVLRFAYFFLIETNGRPPEQVVAQRLLDLTRCLYVPQASLARAIEHVNQEDLAAATYLTRPTVNRVLRAMEAQGIVKLGYGRVEICNVDALFDRASGDARGVIGFASAVRGAPAPSQVQWPDPGSTLARRDAVHNALMSGNWFRALPTEMRSEVLGNLVWRKFKSGETLCHQGEAGDGLQGAISGQFKTIGIASDGARRLLGMLHPGDWTGFAAVLDRKANPLTTFASGDASAVLLPKAACDAIFRADAARYAAIIMPMMGILRFLYDFLIETNGCAPSRLVAQRLHDLARCAYLPAQQPRSFVSGLNQEDLASATGLSRPTVNRILRDLAARAIIDVGYGRITIHDPDALRDFAKHATA